MSLAIVALGSNIEPRVEHIQKALIQLKKIGSNFNLSSIYETPPLGFEAEIEFLNAILTFETKLSPIELLKQLMTIEKEMGRKRKQAGIYESRTIDLDLIGYDAQVIISEKLILPHPNFRERKFVLVPLLEVLPRWVDPITQLSVQELLKKCADKSPLNAIKSKILQ